MSEYLVQGETLTALADAFRAKTGSADSFTLQQMTDMVENVGVSAPPTYYFEFHTFEEKTDSYTVAHNLGFVPEYACFFQFPYELEVGESIPIASGKNFVAGLAYNKEIYTAQVDGSTFQFVKGVTLCSSLDETEATFTPYGKFAAGYTYGFLLWGKP